MPSTDWFTRDRFGMFIHWGLYTVAAGEWQGKRIKHPYSEWLQASEQVPRQAYRRLAAQFDPQAFDAEDWIREAKNAGMRYFLITAKHHDGFALWPTQVSAYNVMDATPCKRDLLGELAQACAKYDVKLGLYYSHWQDWEGTGGDIDTRWLENDEYVHPSDDEFGRYWKTKCLPQVRELIERYDPWFFWFDTWSEASFPYVTAARQAELIAWVRQHSQKCLINSRIQFLDPQPEVDFISTMDNTFPEEGYEKPWETSGTLNDSWAYHALDYDWKSTEQLLRNLVGNASMGGNYQLNVGPMADGRFQPAAIKRLREIGAWMDVNGEAIYGTVASPLGKMPWGRMTARHLDGGGTRLYLHLWEYTPGTAIRVDGLSGKPTCARVLESGQSVPVQAGSDGVWLRLPEALAGIDLPVIALDLEP